MPAAACLEAGCEVPVSFEDFPGALKSSGMFILIFEIVVESILFLICCCMLGCCIFMFRKK